MHDFGTPPAPRRGRAITIWLMLAALLLGPSLLVWAVRGAGFAIGCQPGPEMCHGLPLGEGLRDTLDLAWMLASNENVVLFAGIGAAIAALWARLPLLAFLSALSLPPAALLLPAFAVFSATYHGCALNEGGIGDCQLWGAHMGTSFHQATMAEWGLDILLPYSVASAVMLGLVGVLFFRERRTHQ